MPHCNISKYTIKHTDCMDNIYRLDGPSVIEIRITGKVKIWRLGSNFLRNDGAAYIETSRLTPDKIKRQWVVNFKYKKDFSEELESCGFDPEEFTQDDLITYLLLYDKNVLTSD